MKSKIVNVRLDEDLIREIETLREEGRFVSQSDFIREAIRRLIREVRRERRRKEAQLLAADQAEMARMAEMAEAEFTELARRWEQADRGEL